LLKLIKCEFLKLKRKPLVFISLLLSVFMPLAYAFFLADVNTDVDAVNGVMSSLFQLSAYLLLMPLLVILASNLLFEELDNDTLKNLVTIPINRTKLVLSKMLVLLLFAVGFMAVGGLVNLAVLLFQGWEPVGFWTLFGVGIEEGLIMWVSKCGRTKNWNSKHRKRVPTSVNPCPAADAPDGDFACWEVSQTL